MINRKILLFLFLLMIAGNVFPDNSDDLDIKKIQSKFYNQSDGLYFSISNFIPKKMLNWNIITERNSDNRDDFESEENNIKNIPLGSYKTKDFEKNCLKKIDNTEDLNFIKSCYDYKSSLYSLKKDIDYNSIIKIVEMVSKYNFSLKTYYSPLNYWDNKMQKSSFLSEKIKYDLKLFGINQNENIQNKYTIIPTIELLHSTIYVNIEACIFIVIRINMKVLKDDVEIYNKSFTKISNTDGYDDNWEGSVVVWSFKDMYKIATGVCLRKLLDSFYNDIEKIF